MFEERDTVGRASQINKRGWARVTTLKVNERGGLWRPSLSWISFLVRTIRHVTSIAGIAISGGNPILKSPNFFVLGAPKCGTTALHTFLQEHPDIFLPRIKEPHFYLTDVQGYPRISSRREYDSLFRGANEKHQAVGESSVFYLYSREAVPNILSDHPDAKFIVLLRDPVQLVHSLHSQYVYGFVESEQSFEVAWGLQKDRRQGLRLPQCCSFPQLLQYSQVAMLGEQVERLLNHVPAERVLFIEFNDIQKSFRDVYLRTLGFLGVRDDGRTEFPKINGNRRHSNPWISRLLMHPPFPLNHMKNAAKCCLRLHDTKIMAWIYKTMQVSEARTQLHDDFRRSLQDHFCDDQQKLQRILTQVVE
ncbi:MAG: sulfotransferase [Planctomycetaceae bacterium]